MKLTISVTLIEEEVLILAKEKWRTETINVVTNTETLEGSLPVITSEEVSNPQTAEQFIVSVYQAMIANDATQVFTKYRTQALKDQIAQTEQLIRQDVETAIISSIE